MAINISSYLRILLRQRIHPIPQARLRVHIPRSKVVQPRFLVKFFAVELVRHLLRGRMFVHEQFAVGQVGIELGDVGLGVGDIRGAAEVVGVIEEDGLVRGVGRHIAVTRLHVVGVFGLVPLHGRTRGRVGYGVALGPLYPTIGHAVVAQLLDDGVVALVRVLGLGRRALHCGHSWWRAQLVVVVLALFFYLHHTHLVVFLPGRDDVRAMSVGVLEYACTDLGGRAPVADEIMLGETLSHNAEYGCRVDGVVLGFVELQCKPREKGACSLFRGAA